MKRRGFLKWTAIFGTLLAAGKTLAEKITQGRCGAKCSQCDEQKAGNYEECWFEEFYDAICISSGL